MDLFFKTRSFKVIENFSKLLGLSFLWIAHLFQRRTSPSETLLMLAKNVKDNDPINESENVIKLEPIPGFPVSKANHNLEKIISRSKEVDFENKTPIVLVTTGAFSPIHFEHIKMFEVAKEYLESNHSCYVLGGLISPSHDEYIQSKLKKNFISKAHRFILLLFIILIFFILFQFYLLNFIFFYLFKFHFEQILNQLTFFLFLFYCQNHY